MSHFEEKSDLSLSILCTPDGDEGHPVYLCDNDKEHNMGAILSKEDKKKCVPFIKSNLGKMSQRRIAKKLGVGRTTISRWSSELGFKPIKHTAEYDFFKNWSADMAYVLGYVFSDGNISWKPEKSYRALTITACEKDVRHLENVRNVLKSTKPLLYAKKTRSYRLIVNSETICKDLMRLGITSQKSLTISFPEIPKRFLHHFIRGVIDGDGNVRYVSRKRSPYFEITIASGSKEFCSGLVECIKSLGIDGHVRKANNNVYIAQYTCSRGMKLANIIYGNGGICMERKFRQYRTALVAKGGGQL